MNSLYKIIITAIIIIILFFILLFQEEINDFLKNILISSSNTTPSDCPDYWIKYSKHRNSTGDDFKYGCYIDAKKQPDVVYNGGRCNYINGVRTNFGNMPNYCDVSQSNAIGDNLNLSNTRSGIQLIDGWQSFFKMENLPAVVSIAPQQPKTWVPGRDTDGVDASSNDHLELRYVVLYKYTDRQEVSSGSETIRKYTLANDNVIGTPISLYDAESFSGPSYTITGVEAFNTQAATIKNNFGYSSNLDLDYPSNALDIDLTKYYKNIYKCDTDRLNTYANTGSEGLSTRTIACPTTWRATIPDLPVDTSYVLIYIGAYPENYVNFTPDNSGAYVVSIYDKLTKSYITKEIATVLPSNHSIYLKNASETGDGVDFLGNVESQQNDGSKSLSDYGPRLYIGYLDIYIPYYDPDINTDGSHNTVAGYEMSVFDKLNYCQKRTWAMKNDIHWSGITDNPTLRQCNSSDFFSPVNFDVSFSLTATLNDDCLWSDISNNFYNSNKELCVTDSSDILITSINTVSDSLSWADITNF